MKKIFYSLATAALVFATSTFASANEMVKTASPTVQPPAIHDLIITSDTCEPVHYSNAGSGRSTSDHVCETPASAARLNAAFFSKSDAAILTLFKDETSIKLNNQHQADLIVTYQFFLENETSIALR